MITALALLIAVQDAKTPAQRVSEMLLRYYNAESLSGTITLTQTSGNVAVTVVTELDYVRPDKLSIRQTRRSSFPGQWVVTSDGTAFTYNEPGNADPKVHRLQEPMTTLQGAKLDIRGVYAACSNSLGERPAPLDIAIGRKEDLQALKIQWSTLGAVDAVGTPPAGTTVVGGRWREYDGAAETATYQMWISPSGDLKRFMQFERLMVEAGRPSQLVTSDWVVDLKIGQVPDSKKFVLVK